MSDQNSSEYELVELPRDPEDDSKAGSESKPKVKPGQGAEGVKPLPRLWKTESDDDEPESPPKKPGADSAASAEPAPSSPASRPRSKPRSKSAAREAGEKKALIEETPAFDTYEARQRGRLLIGVLVPACIAIFGYIFYSLFIYDPYGFDVSEEEPPIADVPAPPKRDLEVEARSLFTRACRDTATRGNTDEAIKLLNVLVKSYSSTKSAADAKEALDRPNQNLPLFLDRPTVKAEPAVKPEPAPPPAPPQVVEARPTPAQGNATLTLPANPSELTPSTASPLAMAPAPNVPTPAPPPDRPLPAGFRANREAGVHETGWPLVIVGDRDGAPMMFVPGGSFTMGNDGGPSNEAPAHKVRLSSYYIDQHEVTIRQYRLFLSETRYRGQPPRSWSDEFRQATSETLPMVMVNGRDAQAYAEWAQKQLPTEAQWELAARSTDGRLAPWGDSPGGSDRPAGPMSQLDPAGAYPKDVSPFGVLDLGGNALEWTRDWYDSRYYRALGLEIVDNPTGPASRPRSGELVVKGDRKTGSGATRQGINMDKRLTYVGFRCVLPVTAQGIAGSPSPAAPSGPAGLVPQPQPAARPQPADSVPF